MVKTKNELTLQRFVEDTFQTKEKICFETNVVKFMKNTHVIEPGMIEKNLYFIRSGIIQASIKDKNDDEKIIAFFFPGQLFCSASSFITQKPTDFTFTCINNCVLELIPREPFYKTLEHSILSNKLRAYFLEFIYMLRIKKEKDMLTKTALERYLDLINKHPEYVKQFPVNKIAKYLGIHPQSLSRLRKL